MTIYSPLRYRNSAPAAAATAHTHTHRHPTCALRLSFTRAGCQRPKFRWFDSPLQIAPAICIIPATMKSNPIATIADVVIPDTNSIRLSAEGSHTAGSRLFFAGVGAQKGNIRFSVFAGRGGGAEGTKRRLRRNSSGRKRLDTAQPHGFQSGAEN